MKIINTKEKDWFKELVDSYKNKINIYLKNDGNYDIDPKHVKNIVSEKEVK